MIYRPTNVEITIGTANDVYKATLIRVINTGAAAVANLNYANGTNYAQITIANTSDMVIQKANTDLIVLANGKAVPIAFKA